MNLDESGSRKDLGGAGGGKMFRLYCMKKKKKQFQKKILKEKKSGCGDPCCKSQHSEGRGRWNSMRLRPAYTTERGLVSEKKVSKEQSTGASG